MATTLVYQLQLRILVYTVHGSNQVTIMGMELSHMVGITTHGTPGDPIWVASSICVRYGMLEYCDWCFWTMMLFEISQGTTKILLVGFSAYQKRTNGVQKLHRSLERMSGSSYSWYGTYYRIYRNRIISKSSWSWIPDDDYNDHKSLRGPENNSLLAKGLF